MRSQLIFLNDPLVLKNEGTNSNSYTLSFEGAEWANIRLSDSTAFVINPQETKTINVFVSAKGNARDEQQFFAVVKRNGKTLSQIPLNANIIGAPSSFGSYAAFGIFLLIFIVLLVVGLFFAIRHLQDSKKEDKEYSESYY